MLYIAYGSTRCIYHHKINSYVIYILMKDELITVVVNTIIKK